MGPDEDENFNDDSDENDQTPKLESSHSDSEPVITIRKRHVKSWEKLAQGYAK